MDLTKAFLPDSVKVNDDFFRIHTGHSYWFRFAQLITQEEAYLTEFDFLYVDEKPSDRQEGFLSLYDFYYEKKELPRVEGYSGDKVIDYEIDSDLIYSAFYECYNIDLYETQLHWHKARALLSGLNNTKLNNIMGWRCSTDTKNKEIMRLKRTWGLPEKLTKAEQKEFDAFEAQFEVTNG